MKALLKPFKKTFTCNTFWAYPPLKKKKYLLPVYLLKSEKRLGTSYWQDINTVIIEHNTKKTEEDADKNNPKENEGTINMDASVFEQDITYPTDLKILNASRQKLEEIIATVCVTTNQEMPRTYKRVARRDFLNVSKKKNAAISKYAKAMESS